jgi:hypothetical protein
MTDQSLGISLVFGFTLVLLGLRAIILRYPGGVTVTVLAQLEMISKKARGLAGTVGSLARAHTTTAKQAHAAAVGAGNGASAMRHSRRSPNHQRPRVTHSHYYH